MNNLEMNLPSPKPPPKSDQKPKFTRIAIDAKGVITLNGDTVTLTELKSRLGELKAADPDLAVVVKGSDDTEYQGMVSVLDTLQQLDISKVGLATD
jgi:biopolymer transport protein ExbD